MKNRGFAFAEAAAVAGPVSFSLPPIPYWPQVLGRYLSLPWNQPDSEPKRLSHFIFHSEHPHCMRVIQRLTTFQSHVPFPSFQIAESSRSATCLNRHRQLPSWYHCVLCPLIGLKFALSDWSLLLYPWLSAMKIPG